MHLLRPATKDDLDKLCGDSVSGTVRAIACERNGELLGVAGVMHTSPMQCFLNMTPEMKESPRTIVKAVRMVRKLLDGYIGPVYAIASCEEVTARGFLKHIGFEYVATTFQGDVYQWHPQSPS